MTVKTRKVTYRRNRWKARITVSDPRTGECVGGHTADKTDEHHWIYKYGVKAVKENPELYHEGTVETCYDCHRLANAMRIVYEFTKHHPSRAQNILASMPDEMQQAIINLVETSF